MSGEGWVSAKEALAKLTALSDNPKRQLIDCARLHGSRTRAAQWVRDGQTLEENAPLRYQFWEAVADSGEQDWKLGVFSYSASAMDDHFDASEILHWKAVGVEFFWPDIVAQLGIAVTPTGADSDSTVPERWDPLRGVLPDSATNNDLKHEEAAHLAAMIIRTEKVSRSKAFERSSEHFKGETREQKSIERAIRQSFDKIYTPDGTPRQN